uniref:Argonaute 3 isoform 1 n=1 Tax=Aeolosoma viride TaxID=394736 RepID=A0A1S6Q5Q9_9ANNE|nr:argonaute 3 isoform 1 [Aeolosoma viride]AQV09904.1 argonaute 3 isoform 2 [Aeolosoma viride]
MAGIGRGGRGAALSEFLNNTPRQPGTVVSADVTNAATAQAPARPPNGGGIGRGNLLQQMLQKQQQLNQGSLSSQSELQPLTSVLVSSQSETVPSAGSNDPVAQLSQPKLQPPSIGRGATILGATAAIPSLGRGSMLGSHLQSSNASNAPQSILVPSTFVGSQPSQKTLLQGSPPRVSLQQDTTSPVVTPPKLLSSTSNLVDIKGQMTGSEVTASATAAIPERQEETGAGDNEGHVRLSRLEYMVSRMQMDDAPVVRAGSSGTTVPLTCNYIRVKTKLKGVYQYHVNYDPVVEHIGLRRKLLMQHTNVIGQTVVFDGSIMFLPKQLPDEVTFLRSKRDEDKGMVTVVVKLVKILPHGSCVQMYNMLFRKIMYVLKMVQITRSFYDPHNAIHISQYKMEIWPGYVTAIEEQEGGLLLMADVSHRVLHMNTVLDEIEVMYKSQNNGDPRDAITRALIGTVVMTRYNNKTYKIDDILWDKSPLDTFPQSRGGGEISFIQYYQEAYGKTIREHRQPLLINRPKKKDRNGRKVEGSIICLIPELCYTTGLTGEIRKNFTVMKALAEHTRVTPNQRQFSLRKFLDNINKSPEARAELDRWGLELEPDTLKITGRLLQPEKVHFRDRTADAGAEADWGREIGRQKVITAVRLVNWLVIYTSRNRNDVQEFLRTMFQVCGPMGIEVNAPQEQDLPNDRTENYIAAIRSNLNKQTQLVVCVFNTARDDRYSAVKKVCCVDCPVPSQMINAKTIKAGPKLRSVTQKVLLQMNCKTGGELWALDIPSSSLMVVGIDVYHDGATRTKRSVGAVVCSLNESCTRWYSRAAYQIQGQELMDSLKIILLDALKKFNEVRGKLPDRIVIYRDGVGDGQLQFVQKHEIAQIQDVFRHFAVVDYQPKLTFIVVGKRINTRIFAISNRELTNPAPGMIVDNTITRRNWYDFFIVSQHVRQGTVSPTHYIVVHDESGWSVDIIQKLTYKMTHLYYNWPGTIRVPAPCQNAHKLAALVGQHLHREPDVRLADRLYYL